jgi:transposase-like protein
MKLWFGDRKNEKAGSEQEQEARPTCHGCLSNLTEMVVPVSPEVLSYRCTQCGRQWSIRAPKFNTDPRSS